MSERRLPHSAGAEESVIGSILFSSKALGEVMRLVDDGDFYHPAHKAIYQAAVQVDAAGQPVDLITVTDALRRSGDIAKLRAFDGEAYLVRLATSIATIENVGHHARLIREKATARRLIEACSQIVADGYRDELPVQELIDQAQAAVFGVGRGEAKPRRWLADVARMEAEHLAELGQKPGNHLSGVPTGSWELDDYTGGLQPGDLIVIAARPSMGKSAIALEIVQSAAAYGHPGLVFSLEMSDGQIGRRALARIARVGMGFMKKGLRSDALRKVQRESERLRQLPVEIVDWSAPSLAQVRAEARAWRVWHRDEARRRGQPERIGVVVVDYLQLLGGTGAPRRKGQDYNREREVAEISRGLKALAKELQVPVVALSQLNRGVDQRPLRDRRPRLSDLRESGAVEQDADVVLFVYRDEVYNKKTSDQGIAEIIIGKQRQGETGTVRLRFHAAEARYESEKAPPAQQEIPYDHA